MIILAFTAQDSFIHSFIHSDAEVYIYIYIYAYICVCSYSLLVFYQLSCEFVGHR